MVSFVPHVVLPLLAALAFLRDLPRRWVWGLAFVAWVPDVDYLIPGSHRAWTHNVWIPLAFLGASWMVARRQREPWGSWVVRPGWGLALLLCAYYWASHLVLDFFAGGVVLLWPLLDVNIHYSFEIFVDTSTNTFLPEQQTGTSPGAPELAPVFTWLSYEHTATLAFLASLGLGPLVRRLWRRMRKPSKKEEATR